MKRFQALILTGAAFWMIAAGAPSARADGTVQGKLLGLTPDSVLLGQNERKLEIPRKQIVSKQPGADDLGREITLKYQGTLQRAGSVSTGKHLPKDIDDRAFYPA
jgi:hypothetical protein